MEIASVRAPVRATCNLQPPTNAHTAQMSALADYVSASLKLNANDRIVG